MQSKNGDEKDDDIENLTPLTGFPPMMQQTKPKSVKYSGDSILRKIAASQRNQGRYMKSTKHLPPLVPRPPMPLSIQVPKNPMDLNRDTSIIPKISHQSIE